MLSAGPCVCFAPPRNSGGKKTIATLGYFLDFNFWDSEFAALGCLCGYSGFCLSWIIIQRLKSTKLILDQKYEAEISSSFQLQQLKLCSAHTLLFNSSEIQSIRLTNQFRV